MTVAADIISHDALQRSLFAKMRRSFSGGSHKNSGSDLSGSNHDTNITTPSEVSHTVAIDVKKPIKPRKSLWRKGSTVGKPISVAEVAPALVLSFEQEREGETPPVQVIPRDRLSLPRLIRRRTNASATSASSTTSIPSPAAALALAATTKQALASPESQIKYHQNARLNVKQATELVQLCSQEIKRRGLPTLGIFRPFRAAESVQQQERLVELFLLYIDPKTYSNAFPAGDNSLSALMGDAFGPADPESELKNKLSYANIFDIVSLLKWGLRRLKLQTVDFNSAEHYTWYETFIQVERNAGYPDRAYAEILLPSLPIDTQLLFDTILDLMSTTSAHHVANAMSASKICRILGFWLVGRIGVDHPPHDLQSVVQAWETSARVMEHLLMAYVRDQASRVHFMPSRLMEIVKDYPHFGDNPKCGGLNQETPCLNAFFSSMKIRALYVDIKSENVVISCKRPRGPRETLKAALKAQGADLEASEELDDWSALMGIAASASGDQDPKDEKEDAEARKESALFSEEDARVMQIVTAEIERRRVKSESKPVEALVESTSPAASEEKSEFRFSNQSAKALGLGAQPSPPLVKPRRSSLRKRQSVLTPLSEPILTMPGGDMDWGAFSAEGFDKDKENSGNALDLNLNQAYKPKTELEKAFEEDDKLQRPLVRRQTSMGTLRRKRPNPSYSLQNLSSYNNGSAMLKPTHALQKVSSIAVDETFVHFWQDQLLDDCIAARLPCLLVASFNDRTANRLLGTGMGQVASSTQWLLVSETVVPPRPPIPTSNSRGGRTMSLLRRKSGSNVNGTESIAEKRSLFAPSIRSNLSMSLSKTRDGLKRMGSAVHLRKSRMQDREKVDEEVAEINVASDEL